MPQFEDYLDYIDEALAKRRYKWQLKALNWMAYEDVEQIIRFHIFKKFHLYDPSKPIGPWVSKIITNQLSNLIRNNYTNFSKPCLSCAASEGDELCAIYTKQCNSCPLFARWEKYKKSAFDSKLPLPLENHQQEVFNLTNNKIDIEKSAADLHIKMQTILKPLEWKIYNYLYIEHKTEEQIAKLMNYKNSKNGQKAGYNSIHIIKKRILAKVKKVIYGGEIDFVYL